MPSREDIYQKAVNIVDKSSDIKVSDKEFEKIAMSMWVDYSLLAIKTHLESINQWDNTIVFLLMDHGMLNKGYVTEKGSRILMAMRYPELINKDMLVDNIVSNLDIGVTILDILNIPIPFKVDGKSMLNLIKNNDLYETKPLFIEMNLDRAIISGN